MTKKTFKRKNYFLKDGPQPRLILRVYLIIIFAMLASGAVFYFIGNKNLTGELYQAHSVIKTTMQILLPALLLVAIIGLLGASFLVVSFTHSIAGPIYRLKSLSEKIANGDLSLEVKFRNKDTIGELSCIMNKITKGLNLRLREFSNSLYKLRNLSAKVNEIDRLPPRELAGLRDMLLSVSAELEEEIKKFKL